MPADLPANNGQGAPAQQQQPADDDAAAGHAPVDQDFPADHGFIFHAYDDFDDDSDDEADGFDVPEDAPLVGVAAQHHGHDGLGRCSTAGFSIRVTTCMQV